MNLDFQIREYPEWREKKNNATQELKRCLRYTGLYKIWEGFKTRIDPIQFRQKLREIRVKHIAHT